uniref:GPI mannosyltransferase 2 n=1 Tax=Chromera velia CCMP2878 TaxID=1169474 RepID=A0A0G4F708_9ALVE|eukprot:Cvel_15401.t1-p1 / transcript=Cvel_15401.t1 / gene=Cvel_15401 / organism=Chromera_velia_CCMP2878 / gene_product=GPI mannosyltransferase 2, putative / transcript_product=GPI mannosyltransferase 2, putative / location=Cvel_scaffold1137:21475-23001(+) / protein_length=509 / sequence_SO=supercontig / SO=protein_coding / is_pseudo=false
MKAAGASRVEVIALCALLSRLVTLVLGWVFDFLVPDLDTSSDLLLRSSDTRRGLSFLYWPVKPFLRWDAAHFLHLAVEGYRVELQFAFFPALPLLMRWIGTVLKKVFEIPLGAGAGLGGMVVSNVGFVYACIGLYMFVKEILENEGSHPREAKKRAFRSALFFSFPACSVFMSAPYTESLFCALTFWGSFWLERSLALERQRENQGNLKKEKGPIEQREREKRRGLAGNWGIRWVGVLLFALGSAVRPNGILQLAPLFAVTLCSSAPLWPRVAASPGTGTGSQGEKGKGTGGGNRQRSQEPASPTTLRLWFVSLFCECLPRLLIHWFVAFLQAVTVVSPFVFILWNAYGIFCSRDKENHPAWCNRSMPNVYAHVQREYWGVGPFLYFQAKQIPNFLLAAPALSVAFGRVWSRIYRGGGRGILWSVLSDSSWGYDFVLGFLAVYTLVCANVQVFTRLVSACPTYFLHLGDLSEKRRRGGWDAVYFDVVLFFHVLFFFLGPLLFCNFVNWT